MTYESEYSDIRMDLVAHDQPPIRFSGWDVLGCAAYTLGTALNEVDNGLRIFARFCYAAGQESRRRHFERLEQEAEATARREMAAACEKMFRGEPS